MFMRFLGFVFSAAVFGFAVGAMALVGAIWWYGRDLPSHEQLVDYKPSELSRVLDDDGAVIARFARERRVFTSIDDIPELVKGAFISAEDKNFYGHMGVDPVGIAKAMVRNARNIGKGRRFDGASTITQQVVKNLLLTNERSLTRKLKEAILSVRIERVLSKDRILELYLNQIFFGSRSYGIAAAANTYFRKPLAFLTPEEVAFLAALPKAPSVLHPIRNKDRAQARRDYVLNEMAENGYITPEAAAAAKAKPLVTRLGEDQQAETGYDWAAAYMIEEVRGRLLEQFRRRAALAGAEDPEAEAESVIYGGGLTVQTTLDQEIQGYAAEALREGLHRYDRRTGWRGPVATIEVGEGWHDRLEKVKTPRDLGEWHLAVVLGMTETEAKLGVEDLDDIATLKLAQVAWARELIGEEELGPEPTQISDVLSVGDVVYITQVKPDTAEENPPLEWSLRQIPQVNGAVVAMEADTGRILGMQGGLSAQQSVFNRAIQAERQPGSSFKPFVYAAALDHGYTPASIVLDAPVVVDQGNEEGLWKPSNYRAGRFYGPIPLRIGLEKSRNLITVRVAQDVGMDVITDYAERFGIYDDMPALLSYSLGAGETTLMRMTTAYAMLANGGRRVEPKLVESVLLGDGTATDMTAPWLVANAPGGSGEQVIDPVTAFQTVSLMEGVVQRGTATKLTRLGFPVAGKTGTTNDARDAWFIGFTPDIVFGCYIGYDNPRTLGEKASGGALCGPVFEQFMRNTMADRSPRKFEAPAGVDLVKINRQSGLRVGPEVFSRDVIWEAFRKGTAPTEFDTGSGSDGGVIDDSSGGTGFDTGGSLQPDLDVGGSGANGAAVSAIPSSGGTTLYGDPTLQGTAPLPNGGVIYAPTPAPGTLPLPGAQPIPAPQPSFSEQIFGVPQQPAQQPVVQAPQPVPEIEPLIRYDPVTGQFIVTPDPVLTAQPQAPAVPAQRPAQQPVQQPIQPGLGNSADGLQGSGGLY